MAELGLSLGLSTSSSTADISETSQDEGIPETKRQRRDSTCEPENQRLEDRLNGILCCTVCLDLPTVAMFQCPNGHLMCAACQSHLLADSRLRDETASCPNCRCDIKDSCVRNLAVEKALSELPTECIFCAAKMPRNVIEHHQNSVCKERITSCKYERIGCSWSGPFHDMQTHELQCPHPSKKGNEIIDAVTAIDAKKFSETCLFRNIFDLLSFQKIAVSDPQLKPYRTDDFVTKLYYESGRFSALGSHWVIKATVSEEVRDPTAISERRVNYQLILKSRVSNPMDVHYLVLKGPNSNFKIKPAIYRHEFTPESTESLSKPIPAEDSIECNRILAQRVINLRVLMFQVFNNN